MKRLIDLVKLDRLDRLIRRHATGPPSKLAERLGMSRSSLFELIAFLRDEMQAPIRYSQYHNSYVYEYIPKFYLGFEKDQLSSAGLYGIYGGGIDDVKAYREDDEDSENVILEDDLNFNDLYLDDYN
ncbi:MAG: hypothetical protein LBG45_05015 [Dysgonamonadaceae bacterium]|jgi:hypothetical protein|nr:hypothetical protein [Dysgonamonadaceae bacterium]